MQCRVEESMIKRVRVVEVKCFKCGEKEHKCRGCLLWVRKERAVCVARPQKAQQEERLVMGIKRFDYETKMKARSERQNLQAASQLCTKQIDTGEINQIIESLLKINFQRITKTYQIET